MQVFNIKNLVNTQQQPTENNFVGYIRKRRSDVRYCSCHGLYDSTINSEHTSGEGSLCDELIKCVYNKTI